MKVVVCLKPIQTALVYGNNDRIEKNVINPYDLYALLQVIQQKKDNNLEVIALCMGPMDSVQFLQKVLALGADRCILINDKNFIGSDTFSTSYILGIAIQKIGNVDIVVCGKQSIDGETGYVTYALGERIGFPFITGIKEINKVNEKSVVLKKEYPSREDSIEAKLPVVIGLNDFTLDVPTISLLALKRAKNKEITVWNSEDLNTDISKCGILGSKTKVINVESQIEKKEQYFVEGSLEKKVEFIINKIEDFR